MKKIILITIIMTAAACIAAVFIYRYQIISYSTEKILRSALPDYIKVEGIKFDFNRSKASIMGFKIKGPEAFSDTYITEISEIECGYKMKGKTILDGLEITNPVIKNMVLRIERNSDGTVNLSKMGEVLNAPPKVVAADPVTTSVAAGSAVAAPKGPKASDFIKLPRDFSVRNGKVVIIDRFNMARAHVINFDNIEAGISLNMNDAYSDVLGFASTGSGNLNGNKDEVVGWNITFDPKAPKLTMSSRFDVSGVNILPLEPYYDRYSPFAFSRGRISGTLVFDFNNGNIGSMNELRISELVFSVKPGYENAVVFDTSVKDLVKYFTTASGDVVFDFKIKGDMAAPRFYLGPISKQAVTAMVVDKVSDMIQQMSSKDGAATGSSQNSDIGSAIDMIKGFMDKKK